MGNPAGVLKKKREKRHKKHMLQLIRKDEAAAKAESAPVVEAAKK